MRLVDARCSFTRLWSRGARERTSLVIELTKWVRQRRRQSSTIAAMSTALVTGGTRGIGLGIANSLARDGYDLVLGYNANADAARAAQEQLEKDHGRKVVCVGGDIAAKDTMERLFAAVKEHFNNELAVFVHNAGLYVGVTTGPSDEQPNPFGEDFEPVWDYYQRVYPRAFKRGLDAALACQGLRHVIGVSSPGCNITQPVQPTYEAPGQAKSSVEFLARHYALVLADKGINVNVIVPGFTKTQAWEAVVEKSPMSQEELDGWMMTANPAKRWAEPGEIGDVVAFLCSSRGSLITGVSLPIDGGMHLK